MAKLACIRCGQQVVLTSGDGWAKVKCGACEFYDYVGKLPYEDPADKDEPKAEPAPELGPEAAPEPETERAPLFINRPTTHPIQPVEVMLRQGWVKATCGNAFDFARKDVEWLWPCGFPTGVELSSKAGPALDRAAPCPCMEQGMSTQVRRA